MKNTKFYTQLLILAVLLVSLLTSFAVGKYIQTRRFQSYVTFSFSLAESFVLQESKANQNDDGTYTLDESKTVQANKYILIPGLDIDKDPHIIITEKTDIPAYLFLEVVESEAFNGALRYEPRDNWQTTTLKDPQHGGTVYVYHYDGKDTPAEITEDLKAYILKDNKVYVDQALLHGEASNLLTFYAYLEEIPPEENP